MGVAARPSHACAQAVTCACNCNESACDAKRALNSILSQDGTYARGGTVRLVDGGGDGVVSATDEGGAKVRAGVSAGVEVGAGLGTAVRVTCGVTDKDLMAKLTDSSSAGSTANRCA
jgi:hypothetical protein